MKIRLHKEMFVISALWVRILGSVIFSTGLLFSVCPFFGGIHHEGCILGTIVSVSGLVYFALNPVVSGFLQKIWETRFGHLILCLITGLSGVGIILSIVLSILMIHSAYDKPETENTVVVLGCKVRNGAPSLMLQKRLDTALQYLNQHEDVPVIVCGGQGADESISEAQCMSEYLISHGIDKNRIYLDDTSTSTLENMQNAKEIIAKQGWTPEIIIITDGYHQYRSAKFAQSLGLKTSAVSAKTSWYLVPSYWVREWLGICYQFVFG